MPNDLPDGFHPETIAIRAQTERSGNREHAVPIYMTSSFMFDDAEQARAMFADEIEGNIYTRFSNPNSNELIEKMCLLEDAEDGLTTASGMAAVFVSLAGILKQGDHVVASRAVFGSTHQVLTMLLPRWGIEHTYVDTSASEEDWEKAIQPNTRMIFAETPSNPGLDLLDLQMLGQIAKRHDILLNIDNCFATPFVQKPSEFGADIITHSATKYIDGQGRAIGGIIVGRKDIVKELRFFARHSGPAMSPFNAWIFSKSLETLSIRMEKHANNAMHLAEWLEAEHMQHLESVKYPYLKSYPQYNLAQKQMKSGGGMVCFSVKGGLERGRAFLDNIKLCSLTANLGDSRTIVTHPASTTHSKLSIADREAVGISDGLIRISVGLEHITDIKNDIASALKSSQH
ncbi:MAG: aminotransferase class V-fold PLP-dependent enzyme [Balneolales bacterium]|nr:aminotransferase class V-fold PLP-dependent enzyme [Balneolales bacterium]